MYIVYSISMYSRVIVYTVYSVVYIVYSIQHGVHCIHHESYGVSILYSVYCTLYIKYIASYDIRVLHGVAYVRHVPGVITSPISGVARGVSKWGGGV